MGDHTAIPPSHKKSIGRDLPLGGQIGFDFPKVSKEIPVQVAIQKVRQ